MSKAETVWRFPTGAAITFSPCLAPDGTVYVGSYDYNHPARQVPETGDSTGIHNAIAAGLFADQEDLTELRNHANENKELTLKELWNTRKLKTSKFLLSSVKYVAELAAASLAAGSCINPLIAPLALIAAVTAVLADKTSLPWQLKLNRQKFLMRFKLFPDGSLS